MIKIIGFEPTGDDPVPVVAVRRYDRSLRCWVVQLKDAAGNQIGAADYSQRERTAREYQQWLKQKHPAIAMTKEPTNGR